MQIRNKTLLALGILFVALLTILVCISVYLYLGELVSLETQETQKDVTRVENHFSNQQEDLSGTLHDWAYWDETYVFAADHDPGYITRNVNNASLSTIRIHLLMITDSSGNLLYGTSVNPQTGELVPLSPALREALPLSHAILNHTSPRSTKTGILLLPDGPVLIASTPILASTEIGSPHGVMVMGRAVDSKSLSRINRVTGTQVSLFWEGDPLLTQEEQQILSSLVHGSGVVIIPVSSEQIAGYQVLEDINGRKILLRVDLPRDLYSHGVSLIISYLFLFTCVFLAAAVLIIYFMDRVVLRRVAFLTRKVENLRTGTEPLPKPELEGNDEIAMLEQEILASHNRLAKSEHTLRTFIDTVADPALMLSPDGTILLANAASARLYHTSVEALSGKRIHDFLSQKDLDQHRKKFAEAVSGKARVLYESSAGEREYYVSIFPVVTASGIVEQVAVTTVDITERKLAENALALAKKKLNLLNSVIFTDLQNQIFILLAYLSLGRSPRQKVDPAQLGEKELTAVKAIQSQLSFLQKYQMLGLNPPRWRNLSEVILFAESHLDLKDIVIEKPVRGLEIFADPLIENVFFNLIENSVLHGEHVSVIRIAAREDPVGLVLTVEDDGVGIQDRLKEEIFSKGVGAEGAVGLFLVREILGITGITIREIGTYGRGARFEMIVPKGMYRFSGA